MTHAATPVRKHHAVSVIEATEQAPSLARLTVLLRESADRLQAVQPLIPAALRPAVHAGPLDGSEWCLLVTGNAAAAKLRQLVPALIERLRSRGWETSAIRLRVQTGR